MAPISLHLSGFLRWGVRAGTPLQGAAAVATPAICSAFLRFPGRRPYASAHASSPSLLALLSLCCRARRLRRRGARSGGDDPASAVPRDALLYVEATVRPEGDVRDDALDAAGKILDTPDPRGEDRRAGREGVRRVRGAEARLRARREAVARREGRVLAAPAQREGEEPRGAAVVAATDTDKAQETFDRARQGSEKKFSERSYEDIDYKVNETGDAVAVVEDFAVFGTEAEVKRTINAAERRRRSPTTIATRDTTGELEDERLAHPLRGHQGAASSRRSSEDPEARQQAEQFLRGFEIDKLGPIAGVVLGRRRPARDGRVRRRRAAATSFKKLRRAERARGSTPLLGELPGDSWVALGAPKLGETADGALPAVRRRAGRGGDRAAAALGARARPRAGRVQLDRRRRVLRARRPRWPTIDGGAVIEVTDAEKAQAAFGKLVGLAQSRGGVRREPVQVEGAEHGVRALRARRSRSRSWPRLGEERVVIGYGAEAAEDALSPATTLADGPAYGEAKTLLGDDIEPGFVLSMPAVRRARRVDGGRRSRVREGEAVPRRVQRLASGGKLDDDVARSRVGGRAEVGARSRRAAGRAPGAAPRRRAASPPGRAGARRRAGSAARPGRPPPACAARGGRGPRAAWAASAGPSGAPWRSARRSAATSAGDPAAGLRRSSSASAAAAGTPSAAGRAARRSSAASTPGMPAPDLGQRALGREPGRDRHAQQVQHVGQLGVDRASRAHGPAAAATRRARGTPRRAARPARPARAARARRARARRPSARPAAAAPALTAITSAAGDVEPGGGDPVGERPRRPRPERPADPRQQRDRRAAVARRRGTPHEHRQRRRPRTRPQRRPPAPPASAAPRVARRGAVTRAHRGRARAAIIARG